MCSSESFISTDYGDDNSVEHWRWVASKWHEAYRAEAAANERLRAENKQLSEDNQKLLDYHEGRQVILDWWKDGDIAHVVTTDGEHTYDYTKAYQKLVYKRPSILEEPPGHSEPWEGFAKDIECYMDEQFGGGAR